MDSIWLTLRLNKERKDARTILHVFQMQSRSHTVLPGSRHCNEGGGLNGDSEQQVVPVVEGLPGCFSASQLLSEQNKQQPLSRMSFHVFMRSVTLINRLKHCDIAYHGHLTCDLPDMAWSLLAWCLGILVGVAAEDGESESSAVLEQLTVAMVGSVVDANLLDIRSSTPGKSLLRLGNTAPQQAEEVRAG